MDLVRINAQPLGGSFFEKPREHIDVVLEPDGEKVTKQADENTDAPKNDKEMSKESTFLEGGFAFYPLKGGVCLPS
jgi:hypothetical protein